MCRHGARPHWNIIRGIRGAGGLTGRYGGAWWLEGCPHLPAQITLRLFLYSSPPQFLCLDLSLQSLKSSPSSGFFQSPASRPAPTTVSRRPRAIINWWVHSLPVIFPLLPPPCCYLHPLSPFPNLPLPPGPPSLSSQLLLALLCHFLT